ncbi:MAG: hypothetical protein DMD31_14910 [Gemmatimonadetes bacterium]|nr:MAG: hypothetical protein DMD31_14910 [Gemmatimonadota bacterium]
MEDEGEVDVHAARPLHTLPTGSRVERPDRANVGSLEEVMLDPNDSVVGVVCSASLRVEDTDPPRPQSPVDPPAREDRHGRTARVEADAA